ncbi:major royal jelly protein 9 isoform X2 [Leptinotarsa decemlineata]|uniref:major royal jelly protein 9 isoform X2 n=1 Tax=Leptinotarsa decemlineata TaxID=7539 RepID=UPI003D30D77D
MVRMYWHTPGSKFICLLLGVCSTAVRSSLAANEDLKVIFQWSQVEFDYPSESIRQADINSGNFMPGRPAPIDVDIHYPSDNGATKVFVAIPRFQPGVPVTLGTVSNKVRNGNPIISPYPSWDWHTEPSKCKTDRIVSVFRVMIDECDRLWVLDTGRLLEEIKCPPQILAFDLKTNRLLHRYEIPSSQLESRSTLVTPVVEIRDRRNQCHNTFVYSADCQTYSIIVYDLQRQTSWRVSDKTMYPYPSYGTYNIKGDSFDLMDGILGMSLSPASLGGERKLFYHAMSSATENWVYTSDLRNETRFKQDPASSPGIFTTYRKNRGTQSAAEAFNKDGILFFGLMSDVKIACFNARGDYGDRKSTDIVADNPVTLQFASGMKVIKNRRGVEELFVLTSRFQKVAAGTLNLSEINFRIVTGEVDKLLAGKSCKVNSQQNSIVYPQAGDSGRYSSKPQGNSYA